MDSKASNGMIYASAKHDPGCRDLFGTVKGKIDKHRAEKMDNLEVVPNEGLVVSDDADYPATDHLYVISANYKVTD